MVDVIVVPASVTLVQYRCCAAALRPLHMQQQIKVGTCVTQG